MTLKLFLKKSRDGQVKLQS